MTQAQLIAAIDASLEGEVRIIDNGSTGTAFLGDEGHILVSWDDSGDRSRLYGDTAHVI